MKTILKSAVAFTIAAAVSATMMLGSSANASPIDYEGVYDATSHAASVPHAVWMPRLFDNVASRWDFIPDAGKFTVGAQNATAALTGTIQNQEFSSLQMVVDVTWVLNDPNVQQVQKHGGGAHDGTWSFFDMTTATLTGIGDLAGLTLALYDFPVAGNVPFQLGNGANDKNAGLGAAGWFGWNVLTTGSYNGPAANLPSNHGDFNINLAPVPLPAAGMMLLVGLGGLGALRARKARLT